MDRHSPEKPTYIALIHKATPSSRRGTIRALASRVLGARGRSRSCHENDRRHGGVLFFAAALNAQRTKSMRHARVLPSEAAGDDHHRGATVGSGASLVRWPRLLPNFSALLAFAASWQP